MGNGAGCTSVEQFDESIQMPSPIKRSSTSLSFTQSYKPTPIKRTSIKPTPTKPIPIKPLFNKQQPPPRPMLIVEEEGFAVKRNTDQYSSIWDPSAKLSPTFHQPLRAEFSKSDHHQKETMDTKWTKTSSINLDSTYVESTLDTQTHSCINLSTSERIDELVKNLNRIHTQLDDTIKRRTQQISAETESVLAHIINETQEEQQRLLSYAKEQHTKQDEHYRELLQNYISQLDAMKAKDFAELQNELQDYREQIIHISQMKIMSVNEQANMMKSRIVKEEQEQASTKIDAVSVQLQSLSIDETFQQLGSELITKTNVTTSTNIGTKAAGQNCIFEFVQDAPITDSNNVERPRQVSAKTTYSDVKSERHSNHGEVINQTGKKTSVIPKLQVKEYR